MSKDRAPHPEDFPARAEDRVAKSNVIPARAVDIPVQAEDRAAKSKDIAARAEAISTRVQAHADHHTRAVVGPHNKWQHTGTALSTNRVDHPAPDPSRTCNSPSPTPGLASDRRRNASACNTGIPVYQDEFPRPCS